MYISSAMTIPLEPRIYHIVHIDRLPSILATGGLVSDATMAQAATPHVSIGYEHIKRRRRTQLRLDSHPELFVGECVPFYFAPRSVMLYAIHRRN